MIVGKLEKLIRKLEAVPLVKQKVEVLRSLYLKNGVLPLKHLNIRGELSLFARQQSDLIESHNRKCDEVLSLDDSETFLFSNLLDLKVSKHVSNFKETEINIFESIRESSGDPFGDEMRESMLSCCIAHSAFKLLSLVGEVFWGVTKITDDLLVEQE